MVVTPGRCCWHLVGGPEMLLRCYHAQDRPHVEIARLAAPATPGPGSGCLGS